MIYIKNEALRRLLHLETPYACLADLFDGEVSLAEVLEGSKTIIRK